MTLRYAAWVRCDSRAKNCLGSFHSSVFSSEECDREQQGLAVRREAAECGWTITRPGEPDLCPKCDVHRLDHGRGRNE